MMIVKNESDQLLRGEFEMASGTLRAGRQTVPPGWKSDEWALLADVVRYLSNGAALTIRGDVLQ